MCYKIINDLVAIDCSEFFSFTDCDRTRGHNLKLHTQICRINVRKFSFARGVRPVWNASSYDSVKACTVNSFKCKLGTVNLDLYTC